MSWLDYQRQKPITKVKLALKRHLHLKFFEIILFTLKIPAISYQPMKLPIAVANWKSNMAAKELRVFLLYPSNSNKD